MAMPSLYARTAAAQPNAHGSSVVSLAFDPASETLFKASTDAVFQSTDGGRHWSILKFPAAPMTSLKTVAVSAGAPAALYVAGKGVGVLRSNDGGQRWAARNDGLPSHDVAAFTTHADRPETVYAYVSSKGIFRSEDGGKHWRLMDAGPRGGVTSFIHSNMPGSMQSGWFFVAGSQGVRRAMDCFCSWRDAGDLGRAVRAVAYDPRRPSEIYAAIGAELFFSRDGGEAWSKVDGPAAPIAALVVTPHGEIYAAGVDGRLFAGVADKKSWQPVHS
ncbi:MAG: YCF48-related protein [Caldimonas sp.]